MESHTLILTSPKLDIPESNIIEFTKELIASNLLNIDYFGAEMYNQADYQDAEMIDKHNGTTIITFHFEHHEINYDSFTENETFQFIINLLEQEKIGQVIIDEKDVEIYIN